MKRNPIYLTFLTAILVAFSATGFAQAPGYTLKDSINVREKDKMRQWSYENNLTNYPAKKQNNWALGLKGGYSFISGDVRPEFGSGFAVNLRKALGHILSLRLEGGYSVAKGQNWRKNGGFASNAALNGTIDPNVDYVTAVANGGYPYVYYNHRTQMADVSLQAVFNLNNINFYKKTPKWGVIGFAGVGALMYKTTVDQLNADGNIYNYTFVENTDPNATLAERRKDALNNLRNLQDGEYETMAENHFNRAKVGDYTLIGTVVAGFGLSYRLSRRVSLSLEHRATLTFDDLVDGQRWQEAPQVLSANFDYAQFTSLGLNFRIGKGEDALWWSNPLDHSLDRIRRLDLMVDKGAKDSDGDGVVDALDKESGTPKGAPVDVKGVALDSDGDGIQDFRDAEPYSPKGAQVDRAGLALDSDEDGVPDIYDAEPNSESGAQVDAKGRAIEVQAGGGGNADLNELLPIINFDFGKSKVRSENYPQLWQVAKVMKQNPDLNMRVIGHADNRNTPEFNTKLSKERAENTVTFMVENFGISKDRFVVEAKGYQEPLVEGLPDKRNTKAEDLHRINRRVEFRIVK